MLTDLKLKITSLQKKNNTLIPQHYNLTLFISS